METRSLFNNCIFDGNFDGELKERDNIHVRMWPLVEVRV